MAGSTALICVVAGLPLAWGVYRSPDPRVRALVRILTQLPVALPALVLAFGFVLVFSSDELRWLGSSGLLVAGHVVVCLPYFLHVVLSDMRRLGLNTLEDAADSLGSTRWQRFVLVVLPAVRHSVQGTGTFWPATLPALGVLVLFFLVPVSVIVADAFTGGGFVTQLVAMLGADAAVIGKALFTPTGLAFASSYYLIPRVVMSLVPVLVNLERTQLDAAESLGATPRQAFLHVVLPTIAGPAIGTACLIAAVVFGAYGTALALVGRGVDLLPLQLYSMVSETGSDFAAAAALALVITAACSLVLIAGEWISSRYERHLDN